MPQVRFLHGARDRIQAAAAWIGDAWARREPVTVYAPQRDLADRLDRQLWIAPPLGFIPHCRDHSPLAGETPILITDRPDPGQQHRNLLNLSDEIPPALADYETLVEIVSGDDAVRLSARERVRYYKEQQYDVLFEDVSHGP
ncbi:DNA polymerase III subunit chi [Denitratisoma sp. agr-D3]